MRLRFIFLPEIDHSSARLSIQVHSSIPVVHIWRWSETKIISWCSFHRKRWLAWNKRAGNNPRSTGSTCMLIIGPRQAGLNHWSLVSRVTKTWRQAYRNAAGTASRHSKYGPAARRDAPYTRPFSPASPPALPLLHLLNIGKLGRLKFPQGYYPSSLP